MEKFILQVEDVKVGEAFMLFLDNYKDAVTQFMNNIMKGELGSSDAAIIKEDGVYSIYRTTPNKGWVLAEEKGAPVKFQVKEYSSLETGAKYIVQEGDKLALFVKEPEKEPDLKVGMFGNLNDAFSNIDDQEVSDAVELAVSRKNAAKKVEDDVERKAKLKALAANQETVS